MAIEASRGDLGRGTIISVCISFAHYAILFTLSAFVFPHDTLVGRDTVFQDIGFWPGIAVIGITIVGFSAALSSFIGGARVLQALARDGVFKSLGWLGKGYGKGDEPRRAILLMYIVCEICFFIGDLNVGRWECECECECDDNYRHGFSMSVITIPLF